MSYLPDAVPGPEPTIDDEQFWQYCQNEELRFQRCGYCGRFRHPPRPVCPSCGSLESVWTAASDDSELFSYTVVEYAAHDSVRDALPYNVAIVIYPSLDNLRIVSNVVDLALTELRIGMPLELIFERACNGMKLPRYRKKDAPEGTRDL